MTSRASCSFACYLSSTDCLPHPWSQSFRVRISKRWGRGRGEKAVTKTGGFKFTPTKTRRFDLTAYVRLTPPIYTVPQFIPSPHAMSFHAIPNIFRAGSPRASRGSARFSSYIRRSSMGLHSYLVLTQLTFLFSSHKI